MPTIPDKPLRIAETPATKAEARKRPYESPNRDEEKVKAKLDAAWAIINAEET